ncbi:hypothetical protein HDV00_010968 [Rhizophlyctis rosea]|nr:hypothetical protein HDV00_010968 [Rhizophlyctis rosea]
MSDSQQATAGAPVVASQTRTLAPEVSVQRIVAPEQAANSILTLKRLTEALSDASVSDETAAKIIDHTLTLTETLRTKAKPGYGSSVLETISVSLQRLLVRDIDHPRLNLTDRCAMEELDAQEQPAVRLAENMTTREKLLESITAQEAQVIYDRFQKDIIEAHELYDDMYETDEMEVDDYGLTNEARVEVLWNLKPDEVELVKDMHFTKDTQETETQGGDPQPATGKSVTIDLPPLVIPPRETPVKSALKTPATPATPGASATAKKTPATPGTPAKGKGKSKKRKNEDKHESRPKLSIYAQLPQDELIALATTNADPKTPLTPLPVPPPTPKSEFKAIAKQRRPIENFTGIVIFYPYHKPRCLCFLRS